MTPGSEAAAAADDAGERTPTAADAATANTVPGSGESVSDESVGEASSGEVPTGPSSSRRGRVWAVVAGVLVLALVGVAAWLLVERNSAADRDARRDAYVDKARDTVLNLTTIKPDTAKEDVDRILAGASGEFKSEFDGREDPFVSVVKEAGVTTVGKILEAGFESEDGNAAKVLVAARADVSTPDGTQNGPRDFRMRVTVTDDGGTLTASKVEFVP